MLTLRPSTSFRRPASPNQWIIQPVWEESARPDGVVCYGRSDEPVPFKMAVPAYIKCIDIDGDGRPELVRHGSFQREEIFWQVGAPEHPQLSYEHASGLFPHPLY